MAPAATSRPSLWRVLGRLFWIPIATLTLLVIGWLSLIVTSNPLDPDQLQIVSNALDILERQGFARQATLYRSAVWLRSTDNWWNQYMGHQQAYAATNFPFEVVTLYQPFFSVTVDDVERAAVLLHEAHHLAGAQEEAALQAVWVEKQQLGWTADKYSQTRVWKNTREWTASGAPTLFECGADGRSDCVQ